MKKSSYKPTGFPVGRPRNGEIRPETPQSIAAAKYREDNRYWLLALNRVRVAEWRAANPERALQHSRNKAARDKAYCAWVAKNEAPIQVMVTIDLN